jgi:hypothetical protein
MVIIQDLFDKLGTVVGTHSTLEAFFQIDTLRIFAEVIFIGHNEPCLYFTTGNDKLTTNLMNFKESAIKCLNKMHIYSEWAFSSKNQSDKIKEESKNNYDTFLRNLIPLLIQGCAKITESKELYVIIEKSQL